MPEPRAGPPAATGRCGGASLRDRPQPDPARGIASCQELIDQGYDRNTPPNDPPVIDGANTVFSGAVQTTKATRTGFNISNRMRLNDQFSLTLSARHQYEKLDESSEVAKNDQDFFGVMDAVTALTKLTGPRSGRRKEWGAQLSFDWRPTERLKIEGGIRYDRFWAFDDPARPLPAPHPKPLQGGRPLKVAVVGALSAIKGADVLEDVAAAARKNGTPVEFHLIGYGYRTLRARPRTHLTVYGRYEEADLPALLDWLAPDLVWFPAQWPETYSYTLSACLQGGWPVVAPDLGAFAERLQGRGWTWVQPWDQTPAQWLAFFEDIRQRHWLTGQAPQPCAAAQPEEATHHIPPAPERPVDWYLTDYLAHLPAVQARPGAFHFGGL